MAKPPFLNLRQEDFPEVKEKWMEKLITQLTDFGKRSQQSYQNQLTVSENLNAFWKRMTVQIKVTDRRAEIIPSSYGFKQVGRDIQFEAGYGISNTSPMPPYVNRLGYQVFLGGSFGNIAGATAIKCFKIPEEYRPKFDFRVAQQYMDTNTVRNGYLYIRANGDVEITTTAGAIIQTPNTVVALSSTWTLETLASPIFKGTLDDISGFPVKFKNDLKENKYPRAVFVAQSWDVAEGGRQKIPAVLGGVSYDLQGQDIFVYGIAGARLGRTYEIQFLVIGE